MARSGGVMSIPYPDFTNGTTADADQVDANNADIVAELTNSIAADGQTTPTANLPMGTYKLTGLGAGSAASDSVTLGQVQAGDFKYDTVGGTKNALTLSPSPAITAYAAGQEFIGVIGGTSSDSTVTLAVSGLTTKAVQIDGAALSASVFLEANKIYKFLYDGAQFQASRVSFDTSSFITASSTNTLTNKTFDANGTGNSILNIDVSDLAVGTDGELITWDASGNPATVGVGTAAQVLTSNGAGAPPTFQDAGGGSVELITSTTASAASSVEFNSLDTSTYSRLILMADDVVPGTDGTICQLQLGVSGTFDTGGSDYEDARSRISSLGVSGFGAPQSYMHVCEENLGNSTGENLHFTATIMDLGNSGSRSSILCSYKQRDQSSNMYVGQTSGERVTDKSHDSIKVFQSSGTISGAFKLYGVKAA